MKASSKIKPIEITKAEVAFGGDISKLMPDYSSIPDDFKGSGNKWCDIISSWFFSGLSKDTEFVPKDGIDAEKALNHIMAVLSSWEPKHEHKTSGCAYLLSIWFDDIVMPSK